MFVKWIAVGRLYLAICHFRRLPGLIQVTELAHDAGKTSFAQVPATAERTVGASGLVIEFGNTIRHGREEPDYPKELVHLPRLPCASED